MKVELGSTYSVLGLHDENQLELVLTIKEGSYFGVKYLTRRAQEQQNRVHECNVER